MKRVRDGDVSAFEVVVEHHWSDLRLYTLQLTGDGDLAEDLAQEALARLWSARTNWVIGGSVRVWLLRTAHNEFISQCRQRRIRAEWARQPAGDPSLSIPTPLMDTERTELRSAILEAVADLSPRRREAFTLVHLHGLSYGEAASVMSVREQTVANYLHAALADLRGTLRVYAPADA